MVRKSLRTIRWDPESSPSGPVGELRSVEVRSNEINALRTAISQRWGLFSYREVQHVAQWHTIGGRAFFEEIQTVDAVRLLPEGAWLVFSTTDAPYPASMSINFDDVAPPTPKEEETGRPPRRPDHVDAGMVAPSSIADQQTQLPAAAATDGDDVNAGVVAGVTAAATAAAITTMSNGGGGDADGSAGTSHAGGV